MLERFANAETDVHVLTMSIQFVCMEILIWQKW